MRDTLNFGHNVPLLEYSSKRIVDKEDNANHILTLTDLEKELRKNDPKP